MTLAAGFKWCPGTESNRHDSFESRDFKSRASASFATRASQCNNRSLQDLLRSCVSVDLKSNNAGVPSGVTWTCRIHRFCDKPFNRGELVGWRQMGIPTGHGNGFVLHEFLGRFEGQLPP